jgi:endonuclease III
VGPASRGRARCARRARWLSLPYAFTGVPPADELLNDLDNHPHAFVIACILDRQVKAERAWIIPYRILEELGTFEFHQLRQLSLQEIGELLKGLHRFPSEMSKNIHAALALIDKNYGGHAANIWKGQPPSAEVVLRFLEFRGVGPKIATMAVNLLARYFRIPFGDYYSIDISPDRHVRRVFARLGLAPKRATVEELTYRARALHPEFPGLLDFPTWEIGRNWCKPTRPLCSDCYMHGICPTARHRRR